MPEGKTIKTAATASQTDTAEISPQASSSMMLGAEAEAKNLLSIQQDRIEVALKEDSIELIAAITPYDDREKKSMRQLGVLQLQQKTIKEIKGKIESSEDIDWPQINKSYKNSLDELCENIFVGSHFDLLKARDMIFKEGSGFVEITSDNREELLEEFRTMIEEEKGEYEFELSEGDRDRLGGIKANIEENLKEAEERMFAAIDEKTALAMSLNASEEYHSFRKKEAVKNFELQRQSESKLLSAVENGDLGGLVEALKEVEPAQIKQLIDEKTLLHRACLHGHAHIVAYLLFKLKIDPLYVDKAGYLPVHYAVACDHVNLNAILDILAIKTDAKSLATTKGRLDRTPLQTAALLGNLAACTWLVDKGADIDACAADGPKRSPLHNAASKGHLDIVQMLLDRGANPRARNSAKETPLGEALLADRTNIVQLFLSRGVCLDVDERKYWDSFLKKKDPFRMRKYDLLLRKEQPLMRDSRSASPTSGVGMFDRGIACVSDNPPEPPASRRDPIDQAPAP
jgi:ankyrin repeat protein